MLKNEQGMTKIELILLVIVIMILVSITLFLSIGEEGISFILKNEKQNVVVDNGKQNNLNNVNNDETIYHE